MRKVLSALCWFCSLWCLHLWANPGDENWDPRFSSPNAAGDVYNILVQTNDVYVAGTFTTAGGVSATDLAKWNGSQWTGFDTKASFEMDDVVIYKGTLVAAGSFPTLGLAQWNGSTWSAIGTNFSANLVDTLVATNNMLYVGGQVNINGSSYILGRWDGTNWTGLATGNAYVSKILIEGETLYATGTFTNISGVAANYVARLNGTNWLPLGSGFDQKALCFASSNGEIYAGGEFTLAGGNPANHVAKWDGTNWVALDVGLEKTVRALTFHKGELYAGGDFKTVNGGPANYLAKWNGSSWSAVTGLQGRYVRSLTSSGDDLYVGGALDSADNQTIGNVARYRDGSWYPLGVGVSFGSVSALRSFGNQMYIGGEFRTFTGASANSLVKTDGTNWTSFGLGLEGSPYLGIANTIVVTSNQVSVGGWFRSVDGTPAGNFAQLGTNGWSSPVGPFSGINAHVSASASVGSAPYVGGYSFTSGGGLVRQLGTNWSDMLFSFPEVDTLSVIGTDLYVGGYFTAPSSSATKLAKWNGSSWSAVGSIGSPNNIVNASAVNGTTLYIGGGFNRIGTTTFNYIAKWNGTNWSALGSGMNGPVAAIAVVGSNVYAGGRFTTAGGIRANYIAKWDGTNWFALGSGVGGVESPGVFSISALGNEIYVGGNFARAGNVPCYYLAVWKLQTPSLQATTSANQFSLSWPADTKSYVLQSRTNLSDNWSDVPQSPMLSNSVYSTTVGNPEGTQFFRLRP